MLQQTRVETVIPYFERFLARFPTARALADADEADVLALWSGLGYYRRARSLHATAREVVERFGGALPAGAEALPHARRRRLRTAGAVASIAFDLPEALVDRNVARVLRAGRGDRRADRRPPSNRARGGGRAAARAARGSRPLQRGAHGARRDRVHAARAALRGVPRREAVPRQRRGSGRRAPEDDAEARDQGRAPRVRRAREGRARAPRLSAQARPPSQGSGSRRWSRRARSRPRDRSSARSVCRASTRCARRVASSTRSRRRLAVIVATAAGPARALKAPATRSADGEHAYDAFVWADPTDGARGVSTLTRKILKRAGLG